MNLGATLYVKNSLEAVEFYMETFGMTLGYHAKNSDGSFLHTELLKGRDSIFAVRENSGSVLTRSIANRKMWKTLSYDKVFVI